MSNVMSTNYYLGPPGSFSHYACKFLPKASLKACTDLEEIFFRLKRNKQAKALIPLENTVGGTVKSTIDNLLKFGFKIQAEVYLPVAHNCLSKARNLLQIEQVLSHPQALSQCSAWLKENLPRAKKVGVSSTAEAARLAAKDKTLAALASKEAARIYGLKLLAGHIEDYPANTTRFVLIGNSLRVTGSHNKFACYFTLKHEPGSLMRALKAFADQRLNLSKLESQPLPDRNFEYGFFVEIESNLRDSRAKKALSALKKNVTGLEILGSFINRIEDKTYLLGLLEAISEKFTEGKLDLINFPQGKNFRNLNKALKTRFALMPAIYACKKKARIPIAHKKREDEVRKMRIMRLKDLKGFPEFLDLLFKVSKEMQITGTHCNMLPQNPYSLKELRQLINLIDRCFDLFLLQLKAVDRKSYLKDFLQANM